MLDRLAAQKLAESQVTPYSSPSSATRQRQALIEQPRAMLREREKSLFGVMIAYYECVFNTNLSNNQSDESSEFITKSR